MIPAFRGTRWWRLRCTTKKKIAGSRSGLAISGKVYDVTHFGDHPGGKAIFPEVVGTDATTDFDDVGHSDDAKYAT
jgi:cytochrome b involved in lipid metabolism